MRRVACMVRRDTLEQKEQQKPPEPKDPTPVSHSPRHSHFNSSLRRSSCDQTCGPNGCSPEDSGYPSTEKRTRVSRPHRSESKLGSIAHAGSRGGAPPPPRPLASCFTP